MVTYALNEQLYIAVDYGAEIPGFGLSQLLEDLSFVPTNRLNGEANLHLSVCLDEQSMKVPSAGREVLQADGFRGIEIRDDFYLTDGLSLFHIQPLKGTAEAYLAPSFFRKPLSLQRNFWAFGLMKLLRAVGIFTLHGAGVLSPGEQGLIIAGKSGSGKSTLSIGLIRRGWRYLSDDALLLRARRGHIEALALRRYFYVDHCAASNYTDFAVEETAPDNTGGYRSRIDIEKTYSGQFVPSCIPGILLFPEIVSVSKSTLKQLDNATVLRKLLAESGPQLFDKSMMTQHLELLKQLINQSAVYALQAGSDLYHIPGMLEDLLAEAKR
jgi:hypothetical protein